MVVESRRIDMREAAYGYMAAHASKWRGVVLLEKRDLRNKGERRESPHGSGSRSIKRAQLQNTLSASRRVKDRQAPLSCPDPSSDAPYASVVYKSHYSGTAWPAMLKRRTGAGNCTRSPLHILPTTFLCVHSALAAKEDHERPILTAFPCSRVGGQELHDVENKSKQLAPPAFACAGV